MKNKFLSFICSLTILTACGPSHVVVQSENVEPAPPPQPVEVSYQSFYDEMSPYGRWIDYPGYGYVWMPSVGYGFKPYATNGHWVYTDMGWAWNSDYPWGWAAFHYGRWFFDGSYGWMWMPGQEWSPAWVSWRSSSDYYGWAPLGPSVMVSSNYGYYNPPSNYWCFVPHQYINNPHINNYYVNESRNVTIINNTTVINNYNGNSNGRNVYRGGPNVQEVERYSGSPVRPAVIRESNRPGEQVYNNQFNIYRPRVNTNPVVNPATSRTQKPAPNRVESLRDIRPTTANNNTAGNNPSPAYNNQSANRDNQFQPAPGNNSNPNGNRPALQPERRQSDPVYNPHQEARPQPTDMRNGNPSVQQQAATKPVEMRNGNPSVQQQTATKPVVVPANPAAQNRTPPNNRPSTVNNQRVSTGPAHANQAATPQHPGNNRNAQPAARPATQPHDVKPVPNESNKEKPDTRSPDAARPVDRR